MPAMLTGIALAFSRAVGEYGSVVIVAANIPFQDLIASVLIIQRLEQYDYSGCNGYRYSFAGNFPNSSLSHQPIASLGTTL